MGNRLGDLSSYPWQPTLTGYNSEYSNRCFAEKCNMEGGFVQSPLRLNTDIGAEEIWSKESIDRRATTLAAQAVTVWPVLVLDEELLAAYKPTTATTPTSYTIDDHPAPCHWLMRELF